MGRKPKSPRADYGEWLAYLRHSKGLTQQQVKQLLFDHTQLSAYASSIISTWERTGKLPGRDIILALADIYGVSLETILGVKRTGNGRYVKNDDLIAQAKRENDARQKSIKEKNRDPLL